MKYELDHEVIIDGGPHHTEDAGVLGKVVRLRPGVAFGGTDVVDVSYRDPIDGNRYAGKFRVEKLSAVDAERLRTMAERHEKLAEELRRLAEDTRRCPPRSNL